MAATFPSEGDQSIFVRPHIQYAASTAILCRAGTDLGATLTGHHDFQLADDVIHKVHVGHYTFYSVSVVKNDKLLQKAQGIFCRGYIGGESVSESDLIRCDFTATPCQGHMTAGAAGGAIGPVAPLEAMAGEYFSRLTSTMLIPGEDNRNDWDARLRAMDAAANGRAVRAYNVAVVVGAAPAQVVAAVAGPVAPIPEGYPDALLVEEVLRHVDTWARPSSNSQSLFSDVEDQRDQDRQHGLLLVKGTHCSKKHIYVNPLGLGPVTYSGSSRSRIGKGDPLDPARTDAELNRVQGTM